MKSYPQYDLTFALTHAFYSREVGLWSDDRAPSLAVSQGRSEPRLPLRDYEANLRHIVQRLRAAGILPILMTPPSSGPQVHDLEPLQEPGPQLHNH
jgi:hypothetical protein